MFVISADVVAFVLGEAKQKHGTIAHSEYNEGSITA